MLSPVFAAQASQTTSARPGAGSAARVPGAASAASAVSPMALNAAPAPDSTGILRFLERVIDWYRALAAQKQLATDPNDVVMVNGNRQIADEVVQLAFQYARGAAGNADKVNKSVGQAGDTESSRTQSLERLSAQVDAELQQSKKDVESLKQTLGAATGQKRAKIESQIDALQGEIDLANARKEALAAMLDFVTGTGVGGLGATGLRAQVEELAQTVPGPLAKMPANEKDGALTEQSLPALVNVALQPRPSGIWPLGMDLLRLGGSMRTLDIAIRQTDELTAETKALSSPIVARMKTLVQQGNDLAKAADMSDATQLEQQRKDLDALTVQFKQVTAAMLPLSKLKILLALYKRNLMNWQDAIKGQRTAELRSLFIKLGILVLILAVVFALSEAAKRAILRYVQDAHRRYQFLLLRTIIMWGVIAVVTGFFFAGALGRVATFAGLLTAGVALALQGVLLSMAGYFFLIGKYGVRVGDRVQISGVTGRVVDIGMVRLHVMELAGGETPTGRLVAFANSIVFQPAAGLFKQIPGTNFVWHEVTVTLPPGSDYAAIRKKLLSIVESVVSEYHEDMEKQGQHVQVFAATAKNALHPTSRLRFTDAGPEVAIRFPVTLHNAGEIDEHVTSELMTALEGEFQTPSAAAPRVKLNTDLPGGNSPAMS
jgi:small-conductance mechanosensitive channel